MDEFLKKMKTVGVFLMILLFIFIIIGIYYGVMIFWFVLKLMAFAAIVTLLLHLYYKIKVKK